MTDALSRTITDVVTDFLSSAPSLQEIAAYRLPDELQERAHRLLDANRSGTLSHEDSVEMDQFRQIDHLLTLIKAKARLKLQKQSV